MKILCFGNICILYTSTSIFYLYIFLYYNFLPLSCSFARLRMYCAVIQMFTLVTNRLWRLLQLVIITLKNKRFTVCTLIVYTTITINNWIYQFIYKVCLFKKVLEDARSLKWNWKATLLPTRPLSELLFLLKMKVIKADLCLIKSNKKKKEEPLYFELKLSRNEWTLNRPSPRNTIILPLTTLCSTAAVLINNLFSVDNAIL